MNERKTIAGIDFEAVREMRPRPHWRAKVVETGFIYDAGCFNSESKPKLWESIECTARRLGNDRFAKDTLAAV